MPPLATCLLALDWGTSSLRAYRLGAGGTVLESRRLPGGILHVDRGFERAFADACGDWVRADPGIPIIACGMVGSAQGWREAPYLEVPVNVDALASALTQVTAGDGATLHIVPGLIERGRPPDVMRGEETQIAGALEEAAAGGSTLVGLPGTHCKWAQVRDRNIVHFQTFMTGEIYEVLCAHSLLGRTLKRGAGWDQAAFDRGARVARSPEGRAGVLATVFGTRTLGLTGALAPEAQADYLSGLLIGHELAALEELDRHALDGADAIVLAGDEGLCQRYRRVLAAVGQSRAVVAAESAARGLWRLARAAGLVSAPSQARPLRQALCECGLVAILRGVEPHEVAEIGGALYSAGLRAIEVPLNSREPLTSIRNLRAALGPDCAIGAGTVISVAQVDEVRQAGAEFVVMPHADVSVIRAALAAGLDVAAGVATASEAFAALAAGAHHLKMFPADALGAATLAAWRAVLPPGTSVIPVGGVSLASVPAFVGAGAAALGLGSALYRPGLAAGAVGERATAFVAAWRTAQRDPA